MDREQEVGLPLSASEPKTSAFGSDQNMESLQGHFEYLRREKPELLLPVILEQMGQHLIRLEASLEEHSREVQRWQSDLTASQAEMSADIARKVLEAQGVHQDLKMADEQLSARIGAMELWKGMVEKGLEEIKTAISEVPAITAQRVAVRRFMASVRSQTIDYIIKGVVAMVLGWFGYQILQLQAAIQHLHLIHH